MMQEHTFLWDIVADLNAIWGEDCQRKTWAILGEGNPYESQRRAIVRERLERYRATLAASTPASLHLNANLRASELGQLYQQAAEFCPSLNTSELSDFHRNMINTLRDLTIGYAAASVIAYHQQGIELNLPVSIQAEEDALASSAAAQGLTDADTFLGILHAPTKGGRSLGQPQPRPKEALLKNEKVVAKLKILVDAGFCNSEYGWIAEGHTNFQRAMAAYLIGIKSGIDGYYAAFEDLWGCKYLSSDKAKATQLQAPKAKEKVDEIRKLLDN